MIVRLLGIHLNKQKVVKIASKRRLLWYLTKLRSWNIYLTKTLSTSSIDKKSNHYFWKHWTNERFLICVQRQAKHDLNPKTEPPRKVQPKMTLV